MTIEQEVLVILGLGRNAKPRAATFERAEAETAAKAARALGLKLARAQTPEALALVRVLPKGKLFATGKSLLPLVKRDIYDRLLKAVTVIELPNEETVSQATMEGPWVNPWEKIEVGSTVLARANREEGWFEATVTGVSKDRKILTLKWTNFPKIPQFSAKRLAVALVAKL